MPDDFAVGQVKKRLYQEVVSATNAATADTAMEALLHACALHRYIDAEHCGSGVELIVPLDRGAADASFGNALESLRFLHSRLGGIPPVGLSILLMPDDTYRFAAQEPTDLPLEGHVKYYVQPFAREALVTNETAFEIDRPPGLTSPFAVTYFKELALALAEYRTHKAQNSSCPYLDPAWEDDSRLLFSNKPEHHMRRSLNEYLNVRLRDAEPVVLQEQNVNETKPVDIRIQWLDSHRVSLLEVKWLGDSVNEEGTRLTTPYRDARAREGYRQTYDYLLDQRLTLPTHIVHARLVVFDGRRGGIVFKEGAPASCAKPWAYWDREIDYSTVNVDDAGMEEPIRFYLEPNTPKAA